MSAVPRLLPALLLTGVLAASGCGSDDELAETGFSKQVRDSFLRSCVDNAARTSGGASSKEELTRTCECILGRVEQEYDEQEFTEFEQRLLGGQASDQESQRLVGWSTACAESTAG